MTTAPDPKTVREVTQWFLAGREDGIPGDCVRASVASLLDLDPAQVPHFTCQDDTRVWPLALTAFAAEHGWRIDRRAVNVEGEPLPEYGIAIGPSPRGISHAVVVRHGEMVWDPHPSREGLVDVQQVIEFTRAVSWPAEQPQDGCAVRVLDMLDANPDRFKDSEEEDLRAVLHGLFQCTAEAANLLSALNAAYRERAHLLGLLSAVYPSHIGRTDPSTPDWAVVTLQLPTGQAAWHISADDEDLFQHVEHDPENAIEYDGHSTEEKYARIRTLTDEIAAVQEAMEPDVMAMPRVEDEQPQDAQPERDGDVRAVEAALQAWAVGDNAKLDSALMTLREVFIGRIAELQVRAFRQFAVDAELGEMLEEGAADA